MSTQTSYCKNCKNVFDISLDDQNFYGKIGVTAPTHCPQCRMQPRLAFRNERTLYKRTCDLCKGNLISLYNPSSPFPVYCTKCWWGDQWDAMSYGKQYDPNKSFFEQFEAFSKIVPRLGIPNTASNYNCEYCSWMDDSKNCYLLFGSTRCEETMYS